MQGAAASGKSKAQLLRTSAPKKGRKAAEPSPSPDDSSTYLGALL
jgi:hypothetical protein